VGTSAAALATETETFTRFLERLQATPSLAQTPGALCLASSAGGVYGGCKARPITEDTATAPISDYGRAKLRQEELLAAWARDQPTVATLVARLSNLYGPGQRLDKPQGLISQMARAQILGLPVHIFVSLDTIRDYLFADDAGARVASSVDFLHRGGGPSHVTKIFACEREISIAGLIGVFRRMARRQLRVTSGLLPVSSQHPGVLQFRSKVWTGPMKPVTELLEGIRRVFDHQLRMFQMGLLPAPGVGPAPGTRANIQRLLTPATRIGTPPLPVGHGTERRHA
jgi:UDP-glucose 4-epimerase